MIIQPFRVPRMATHGAGARDAAATPWALTYNDDFATYARGSNVANRIKRDSTRFRDIVRGKIRQNLRKYINHGEMIGRRGQRAVSIPVPSLDVPHFKFGKNGSGGVGQGDGEEGDILSQGDGEGGAGKAGSEPGDGHLLEVEVTLEELAQMMGDELELPRIEPKGEANIIQEKARYNSIRRAGPASLRHFKRTYMAALKRQISSNTYDLSRPRIVPYREDMRYRSWTVVQKPESKAVIIYMMDVSGSMTDEQKQVVRTEAFWIDAWIKSQYEGVETRYIIHDAVAKEVDEHTFYHTRESGGTRISSAYKVCVDLITEQFPPAEWNIYAFQFSDGDNWGEDNDESLQLLQHDIVPKVNLYCYGQVESPYGSGDYIRSLEGVFGTEHDSVILSEIADKEAIFDSIKLFLGKGR